VPDNGRLSNGNQLQVFLTNANIAPYCGSTKSWSQTVRQDIVAPDVEIVSWSDEKYFDKVVPSITIVNESGDINIRRKQRP